MGVGWGGVGVDYWGSFVEYAPYPKIVKFYTKSINFH